MFKVVGLLILALAMQDTMTLMVKRQFKAELEIVVELGNLVPRKNLVSQKVFFDFEVFTELNSKNVSEITAKIICFA